MHAAAHLCLAAALAAIAASAQAGGPPTLLGASRNWTAYQANTPDGKVCYAVAMPAGTQPKKLARDAIYVIISTWPDRNVTDEMQIVPGYQYKDGRPVVAQVGSHKASFFTQNDGPAGMAWAEDAADESSLVAAMHDAATMVVTGTSKRGTKTTDTYALAGLDSALVRAHAACQK